MEEKNLLKVLNIKNETQRKASLVVGVQSIIKKIIR